MRIAAAIVTIRRPTLQHLASTIESMRSDPVFRDFARIAVCNGSPDPVESVDVDELLTTPESTWEAWKRDHGGYRLTRNLLRAHRWLSTQNADLCVFAEDDILLAKDWMSRAKALCDDIVKRHPRFALCCCSSHPSWCFDEAVQCGSDAYARFKDPRLFWGNQILVYPASVIAAMTSHVQTCVAKWRNSRPGHVDPNDSLLIGDQATKTFFQETGCPLFVSIPSLAKHVGKENTWSIPGADSVAFRDHPTARWDED